MMMKKCKASSGDDDQEKKRKFIICSDVGEIMQESSSNTTSSYSGHHHDHEQQHLIKTRRLMTPQPENLSSSTQPSFQGELISCELNISLSSTSHHELALSSRSCSCSSSDHDHHQLPANNPSRYSKFALDLVQLEQDDDNEAEDLVSEDFATKSAGHSVVNFRHKRESTTTRSSTKVATEDESYPSDQLDTTASPPRSLQASYRSRSAAPIVPSEDELEEFFAAAEKNVQKQFTDKYNYDIVKDEPILEGRYEWVPIQLKP